MRQLLTLPFTRLSDLKAIATAQQPAATRRRIGYIRAGTGLTAATSAPGDWAHCCRIRARSLPHIDAARKLAD